MGLLTSNEQGRLFSLITQFTRSTDTRRSSRAHRGVRGALVPGLVTESRADGLESRTLREIGWQKLREKEGGIGF